jgi:hypothetical protein
MKHSANSRRVATATFDILINNGLIPALTLCGRREVREVREFFPLLPGGTYSAGGGRCGRTPYRGSRFLPSRSKCERFHGSQIQRSLSISLAMMILRWIAPRIESLKLLRWRSANFLGSSAESAFSATLA